MTAPVTISAGRLTVATLVMALTLAACSGAETVPLRTSAGQSMHAPDAATSKATDKNTTADKLVEAIGMSLSDCPRS